MANEDLYTVAQRMLVESLLYKGSEATTVFGIIMPEDVVEPTLSTIITAIANVERQRGGGVSAETVAAELDSMGRLAATGGIANLYSMRDKGRKHLLDKPISAIASIVKEASVKNRIEVSLRDSLGMFKSDSGHSVKEAISDVQSKLSTELANINDASTTVEVSEYVMSYNDLLAERLEKTIENESNVEGLQGIPAFQPSLNKYTFGWLPADMITVAARTGVGKTVLAINSMVAAARAGKSCLFFSLEMGEADIIDRIISCMSGVSLKDLKSGRLNDGQKTQLESALVELKSMKITIEVEPNVTMDSIFARAKAVAQGPKGLDMILLDYLQLVKAPRAHSRQEAVAEMSRQTKLMAKTLQVAVMVLVQLNRASRDEEEDRLPTIDDIRESGSIAMDSDVVILIHRERGFDGGIPNTLLIIGKNRRGETNKIINCHSNLAQSTFREVERRTTEDTGEMSEEDRQKMDELSEIDPDLSLNEETTSWESLSFGAGVSSLPDLDDDDDDLAGLDGFDPDMEPDF